MVHKFFIKTTVYKKNHTRTLSRSGIQSTHTL